MDFEGIGSHTFGSEDCAVEADLGLPDAALGTVEDDCVLTYHLHELHQVSVMLLGGLAIDAYVVVDHSDAGEAVCHLVHTHLEHVLRHL